MGGVMAKQGDGAPLLFEFSHGTDECLLVGEDIDDELVFKRLPPYRPRLQFRKVAFVTRKHAEGLVQCSRLM